MIHDCEHFEFAKKWLHEAGACATAGPAPRGRESIAAAAANRPLPRSKLRQLDSIATSHSIDPRARARSNLVGFLAIELSRARRLHE
jgi:hypothetical protein